MNGENPAAMSSRVERACIRYIHGAKRAGVGTVHLVCLKWHGSSCAFVRAVDGQCGPEGRGWEQWL